MITTAGSPIANAESGAAQSCPAEKLGVFAAYPNQWATVHTAGCCQCRGGRGQKGAPAKLATTDRLGPFATREASLRPNHRHGAEERP